MILFSCFKRMRRSRVWLAATLFILLNLPFSVGASTAMTLRLVKDINPSGDASPDFLTAAGDAVYFYASTGQVRQFFVADEQGVTQLTSLANGAGCLAKEEYGWPIISGDAIYFGVAVGDNCQMTQVWRTDGTPAGTSLVTEFTILTSIHAASKGFFALGFVDGGGRGVWYSDGSGGGTRLVHSLASYGDDIATLSVFHDHLYVPVWKSDYNYYEVWRVGSTTATLLPIKTLRDYVHGVVYRDTLYIASGQGEIWRLAAGSDTPVLWQDGSKFYGMIARMIVSGDRLYLVDSDRSRPLIQVTETLWRYEGASEQLDEIATYSEIRGPVSMGDSDYFAGRQWSDPPKEGSVLLRLRVNGMTPVAVSPEFALNGDKSIDQIETDGSSLYMRVRPPGTGGDLWLSDGSAAGTRQLISLADTFNGWYADACPCLAVAGGRAYFDRKTTETGVELWTMDATIVAPTATPTAAPTAIPTATPVVAPVATPPAASLHLPLINRP